MDWKSDWLWAANFLEQHLISGGIGVMSSVFQQKGNVVQCVVPNRPCCSQVRTGRPFQKGNVASNQNMRAEYIFMVSRTSLLTVTKCWQKLGRKDLLCRSLGTGSHGGRDSRQQVRLHAVRKQISECWCSAWVLFLFSVVPQSVGWCCPAFRVNLPLSMFPWWL